MKKWVFLIGNGLGLSLDDKFFSLDKGMEEAWNKLNEQEKKLIEALLGKRPQNEEDLLSLQYFNKAIRSLNQPSINLKIGNLCLSPLPDLIEEFRKCVAASYICHPGNGVFTDRRFINFASQLA